MIENTAQATYDTASGAQTVLSNTVELAVDELLDVTLISRDGAPVGSAPGSATLTFELTNTGNGPEAFRLTATAPVAGNDFDTTVETIAIDSNGNGIYDPGVDMELTGPETTPVLAPDEAVTIFVTVLVPTTAADGDQSQVELVALALTGSGTPGTTFAGAGVGGVDAIVGANSASDTAAGTLIAGITTVSLVKSQSVRDPFGGSGTVPGSVITYTITANVVGSGSVSNLVVTDAYPAGTAYVPGSLDLDSAPLTDAAGDDAGEAGTAGISVTLGTVAGGSSPSITFDVTVNQN